MEHSKQINITIKASAVVKDPSIKSFYGNAQKGNMKSIRAHMHSPQGVIRIWSEFPHIHQACWNTIDFKSCFWAAELTRGGLLPLCWHKFTSTIEPRGDQMWPWTNHWFSCRLNDLCNVTLGPWILPTRSRLNLVSQWDTRADTYRRLVFRERPYRELKRILVTSLQPASNVF